MKPKIMCFFTTSYPYDKGETFIENELNFIAPNFNKVYLFHKYKSGIAREIPENVELIHIEAPKSDALKESIKRNFLLYFFLFFSEVIFSRQKKMFLANLKYNLNHFANCIYYAKQINDKLDNDVRQNAVFYSYWFFDWNLSLSILKKRKEIMYSVTRTHGFDLYENNGTPNYLPLRKFCLQHTDKIITISKLGEKYLKNIYPKFAQKIYCSYLGTKDHGLNPIPLENRIHIVSCSNVIAVKRVHLIIKILKHINAKVLWTHIGDGICFDAIKVEADELPKSILIDFKGRLNQKEIFEFYTSTPIDVFINVSISEGIPVSIMEATSFGIPVIATNVGGTSEIVNEQTGVLIEKYFDSKHVAECILQIKHKSEARLYRERIRNYWQANFSADKNYSLFVEKIKEL